MKTLFLTVGVLTAAAALTIGLNGAWASSHSTAARTTVGVGSSGLGRILVDGRGHTLYLFAKDTRGKSACAGACAVAWPPLIATGRPLAAAGAKMSLLGTTKRADGRLQVTYRHHPLYLFVKDAKKGETNGEEVDAFGAEWYVLSPAGASIEKAASASSGAPMSGGGYSSGGYGY
jgi:predicted lipoprotein with Yx(FWY)xxD motif